MSLIIEDVKQGITIEPDNLGFDGELYLQLNAAKSILVQLGVDELNISVDESTSWPIFDSDLIGELSKQYMVLKIKTIFDPTASETIAKAHSDFLSELESRIVHEIDEEAANV